MNDDYDPQLKLDWLARLQGLPGSLYAKLGTADRVGMDGVASALWSLALKYNTDDMREAPTLVVVNDPLKRGPAMVAHDPVSPDEARRLLQGGAGIDFVEHAEGVVEVADVPLIVTECKNPRSRDFDFIKMTLMQGQRVEHCSNG